MVSFECFTIELCDSYKLLITVGLVEEFASWHLFRSITVTGIESMIDGDRYKLISRDNDPDSSFAT